MKSMQPKQKSAGQILLGFLTAPFRMFCDHQDMKQSEREQLRYLPQSVKLEEAVNPHIVRMTMLLISGAILIFAGWASITNINEVAKTKGQIVPKGFVQVVQHLDGGIVTNILTNEGDLVKKGQSLLKIDDGAAKQDYAEAKAKHLFLQIEAERLQAFIKDIAPNFERFAKNSNTKVDYENPDLQAPKGLKVKEMHERSKKLKENLQIAKEALGVKTKLYKKGLTSKLTLLQYQKDVSNIEAEAYQQLNQIEREIAQNDEVITKLRQKVKRLDVRSPVYGLVKGLQVNTIGGVIKPGETLMELVPLDKNLVLEAHISPRDIGHVNIGQTVRVKISSYDFSRYGTVNGTLEFVSATTFLNKSGNPYYRGRIRLSKNYVGKNPKANIIMPGMTAEADIITGEKTILAYLLKPIHLSLKTAFTER